MKAPGGIYSSLTRLYARCSPTGRGSYALARRAAARVKKNQRKGKFTTSAGLKLSLNLDTYPDVAMAYGAYEIETARLIRRLLKPGGWFVDCGANIGYFSMLAAKRVGQTGRIDAFEPDPINRSALENHLRDNAIANVRVHPMAVANHPGTVKIFHPTGSSDNHGMASLFPGAVSSGLSFEVETVRLDQRLEDAPDLIKMDVEGAELVALEGATGLLIAEKPPAIIIEHNPDTAKIARFKPGDIFELLTHIQPRYELYWIGWRLTRIRSADELNNITRQGNLLAKARS